MIEDSTHTRELCQACREEEYAAFRHHCVHLGIAANERWNREYGLFEMDWYFDADVSTLTFSKQGKPHTIAQVVVTGTTEGNQWQWTWSNKNSPMHARKIMEFVRIFGEKRGWDELTRPFNTADTYTGWEFNAVALHILDAQWAYRFPADHGFCYCVAIATNKIAE